MKKINEFIKKMIKLNFNLFFTTSKLLGYIIIFFGFYLSYKLKSDEPWMWSVIGATALFGVKIWSKKIDNVLKNNENTN